MKGKICLALDVSSRKEAMDLVRPLRDLTGMFKVGMQLFTAEGPSLIREIIGVGGKVFLDLKFHDIPNTVAGAVRAAVRLGAWMVNVHAAGGRAMMRAAREAAQDEAVRSGRSVPILIAVTMLTSLGEDDLPAIGMAGPIADQVARLAALVQESGLDGVVASPQEVQLIRRRCGARFAIVTPGIRGRDDERGDQTRTMSAAEALASGSTYLVVGRPIIAAADPRGAAERMAAECRAIRTP